MFEKLKKKYFHRNKKTHKKKVGVLQIMGQYVRESFEADRDPTEYDVGVRN
ncbi:hypothetical protein HY988_04710 [Candidatus Micrarchaeota archaeon]|nr:hypothetical protein [Candidatus Micrarchaeota archaeon]